MALNSNIHWGYILRINVDQPIDQEGWKHLLLEARHGFNFDGEIFGLGFRMVEAGRFVTEPIKWSYTGSLSLILIPLSLKDLDGCLPLPLAPHKTRHYTSAEDAAAI